jgi:hypothetical protein
MDKVINSFSFIVYISHKVLAEVHFLKILNQKKHYENSNFNNRYFSDFIYWDILNLKMFF